MLQLDARRRARGPRSLLGALAIVAFGGRGSCFGDTPAALVGLAAYAAILVVVRPPGLRHAWAYMRTLH